MHKTFGKKIAGGLMAATMAVSAATAVIAPMGAFAGDQLGQSTFDEGIGLPWHTCETNPAKQTFDIKNGTYNVHIVNKDGDDGRWDLQLRHRGLKIVAGHTYEVSGEITADKDGTIYSKISDYAGKTEVWHDLGAGEWQPYNLKANQTLKFSSTFTANASLDVAEWAFHYANNNGKYDNFDTGMANGATISFDNLVLIDKTSDENDFDKTNEFGVIRPKSNVRLNQVGYYPNLKKKASYVTDASEPLEFEVRDSSGKAVYTGTSTVFGADPDSGTPKTEDVKIGDETYTKYKDSGSNVHILDFSDFKDEGVYTIFVKDTTGVSGTQSGMKEAAYDTKMDGDNVVWENWVTGESYVMNQSHQFRIDTNIYSEDLVRDSISYFYQNRSGVPIEAQYIKNGDASTLSHSEYGHGKDEAYVQSKWQKSYGATFDGDKKYSIDVTGGWYDAGDHGKYVVNGGISVWTLQNAYEMSKKNGTDAIWDDNGAVLIPENSNGAPNILDEAKVELDFMLAMMVDSKDPYWGQYEGMVYHKMHDHKWTGLAIHSWKYEGFEDCERIVKPPTYAATYNLAATAAQAARLWKGIDDAYADKCLAAAKKAYEAANKNLKPYDKSKADDANAQPLYAPMDQAIGGGAYGDTYVEDDKYWAACELYATTGDETYYNDLKSYSNPFDAATDKAFSITTNLGGGENNGSFSSFNWGCTSGLGTLSLYLSDKLNDSDRATVESAITAAADTYMEQMSKEGMGIPYKGATFTDPVNIGYDSSGKLIEIEGYEWGSNSFVINNAIVMAYAYDATKNVEYMNGTAEAMDYIFGRNGNDFSYVSGYGDVESGTVLQWPHHRFWANGVDPSFPKVPAGVMSGGPGAGMQDPYIGGLGYQRGTLANQKCYVDNAEAWSVNEITINWNSPLVWISSFMNAEAAKADGSQPSSKPTTQPTTGGEDDILWGDTNCDGKVTLADAVLIMQALSNPNEYKISEQGQKNGDVVDNGNGITPIDALAIQYVDLEIITTDVFPMTSDALNSAG
ncbi:MAG: glycoside hydrolase family 9 protein [Ruminococcus flavefaciens]|nr:glycoside hydrolase family 9 protein [Ruminococcus flavefaciens]